MRYKEFDLAPANKILTRKIINLLAVLFIYVLLLSIGEALGAPIQQCSMLFSNLFPKLTAAGGISTNTYILFSESIYLLAPFSVFYLCKGDPLHQRWKRAIRRDGEISTKRLAFLYIIGMPALVTIIFASYKVLSSARFHKGYNTSGAKLFEGIANSHMSLVFAGPFVAVGVWGFFFLMIALLAFRSAQPKSKY